jgi:hypothetical protein
MPVVKTPRSDDFFARAAEPAEVSNYRRISEHRYYASSLQQSNIGTSGLIVGLKTPLGCHL